jgi:FAD/FMN-containing dehydrogenase
LRSLWLAVATFLTRSQAAQHRPPLAWHVLAVRAFADPFPQPAATSLCALPSLTSSNVAPFVEMEWGSKAYELMWELKAMFDPDFVLNPGEKIWVLTGSN